MKALLATLALVFATVLPARAQNANPVSYVTGTITSNCTTAQAQAGSCPAGSFIQLNPGNYIGVRFSLAGSFSATFQLFASVVGSCNTYQAISFYNRSNLDQVASSTTTPGIYDANGMNLCNIELVATTFTTGSVAAILTAGPALVTYNAGATSGNSGGNVGINSPLDVNGNVKVADQLLPLDGSNNVRTAVQNFPSTTTVVQATGTNLHVVCDGNTCSASPPWSYFAVPATTTCVSAVCVVKASSGTLAGLVNESTSAQPAGNCTIYDNASAASGQILYVENGIGAGQVITLSQIGIKAVNGIVIQCAATPGGSGLLVLFQ